MSTTKSSQELAQSLVDLAWSLWTELGVSGWSRRHDAWCIDLEPLILLTAALEDADPRLRDESTDWCIRYARFVSAARLRTLLRLVDEHTRRAFDEYAATVRSHAQVNWPANGPGRQYRPTGRSRLEDLSRPALFGVRQRALFGTGARAEVVRILATAPDRSFSTAEIADAAAFTKRAIEQELDSLVLAGAIHRTKLHGRHYARVAEPDVLLPFVGGRPQWTPTWPPLMRVLLGGLHVLTRVEPLPPIVRAVEARKYLADASLDIERAGLPRPSLDTVGVAIWGECESWLLQCGTILAAGDPAVLSAQSFSAKR
jgi:hypothetical protein